MHVWYTFGTLFEALTSSMIGTRPMVDMAFIYEDTS
jgi:hypothetical protein